MAAKIFDKETILDLTVNIIPLHTPMERRRMPNR